MIKYQNLYIIGTSHIAKSSILEIKNAFSKLNPDIIAVELDKNRLTALLSKKTRGPSFYDIGKVGFKGFLFAIIGSWASKKLGKIVGVDPGTDMKTAVMLAKKNMKNLFLIDQHIEVTLKRFSKTLTAKEKWRLFADLFNGLILRKKDPLLKFDLSKVPSNTLIKKMVSRLKQRYPNIHKVLIEERNYFMARKLKKLMKSYPDKIILATLGAGHIDDILKILKDNEGISYSFTYSQ